jgi:hypothetical protein
MPVDIAIRFETGLRDIAVVLVLGIGEWIFCFWLLIKGVRIPKIEALS